MAGKLSIARIKALTEPGLYGDGGTLYLRVAPGGSKSWVQRVTIGGRRRDIGLGGFPVTSLARARQRSFEIRVAIAEGRDPIAEKLKAKVPTFRKAAEATFEAHRAGWRNRKHTANWMQQMERYAFPVFGDRRVNEIEAGDVLGVLMPIWSTRAPTARKLRQRIRTVLGWAESYGYVDGNAAGERISGALPATPKTANHFRSLPYKDLPDAISTIESSRSSVTVKSCLLFVVHTACRSVEAREATWAEVDEDASEWRIPGARTKTGEEHRVPLTNAATDLLERVAALRDGSDLLFPSPTRPGKPMSDMTLTKVLRDNGIAERATVHGFRATFRTWASEETEADYATMELSLGHTVGSDIERAYSRGTLFEKRRILMAAWSDFVEGDRVDAA